MIIVRLQGGLGNQMFQYATALRLATNHRTALKLDLTFLLDPHPPDNITPRTYDLDLFQIPEQPATAAEVQRFRRLLAPGSRSLVERAADKLSPPAIYLEQSLQFDPRVLELPGHTYLEGYFQHENYFKEIEPVLRQRFSFRFDENSLPEPARQLAERIRSTESICLNIRRGDYLSNAATNQHHGVCNIDYYKAAAARFLDQRPNSHFYIFSDDPDWSQKYLTLLGQASHVPAEMNGPRFFHKFWLMTLCKHFIIANSSFGWWAAWLAQFPQKQIICPTPWLQAVPDFDNCPPSWIKLPAC